MGTKPHPLRASQQSQRPVGARRRWGAAATIGALAGALLLNGSLPQRAAAQTRYAGFDSNEFPSAAALPVLRSHFSYLGYWLNTPPGATKNPWTGKRTQLVDAGFGFLVLWNGRLDAELKRSAHRGRTPAQVAEADAAAAVERARSEGFHTGTLLFLDQEEGGRLLPEQAAYLLGWTEAVARTGFLPGVYASGQPVPDGGGRTITTAQDIAARVAAGHLHPVALWVAQDTCGPAPGCVLPPPAAPGGSGTPGALVWQYAQSPRRPELTRSCARTYAADGDCELPGLPAVPLDLNVAGSPDPSHGRQ